MDLFDKMLSADAGIVRESGDVVKCMDDQREGFQVCASISHLTPHSPLREQRGSSQPVGALDSFVALVEQRAAQCGEGISIAASSIWGAVVQLV